MVWSIPAARAPRIAPGGYAAFAHGVGYRLVALAFLPGLLKFVVPVSASIANASAHHPLLRLIDRLSRYITRGLAPISRVN